MCLALYFISHCVDALACRFDEVAPGIHFVLRYLKFLGRALNNANRVFQILKDEDQTLRVGAN